MDLCFTNASETARFWDTYLDTNPWDEDPPYASLDGFHVGMIMPDLLHVLNLGVGRDLTGAILTILIKENHIFDGATINEKLATATVSLRNFARREQLPLRIKKLTKKKLNWGRFAELRSGSGYDIAVIGKWLQDVRTGHDNIYPQFCTLLWALNGAMEIMYSGPWYLTEGDRSRIRTLGSVFMRVYLKLATEALSQNKFLWKCRPKLHLLHHIFRCHQRITPP